MSNWYSLRSPIVLVVAALVAVVVLAVLVIVTAPLITTGLQAQAPGITPVPGAVVGTPVITAAPPPGFVPAGPQVQPTPPTPIISRSVGSYDPRADYVAQQLGISVQDVLAQAGTDDMETFIMKNAQRLDTRGYGFSEQQPDGSWKDIYVTVPPLGTPWTPVLPKATRTPTLKP